MRREADIQSSFNKLSITDFLVTLTQKKPEEEKN